MVIGADVGADLEPIIVDAVEGTVELAADALVD